MNNPFFKNTGPHNINLLLKTVNLNNKDLPDDKITDIKDLNSSQKNEITFFHSKKYFDLAKKTKASYCLTSENFQSFLPNNCKPIITDKVLLHTAQITKIFYPDSITDDYDNTVKDITETEFKDKIKYGKNVLIGFCSFFLMTILMLVTIGIQPAEDEWVSMVQESLAILFTPMTSIFVASMIAYLISQYFEILIFQYH